MKVILCAATEMEIGPTIHFLSKNPVDAINILVTGVGLTAATYALTKAVADSRPDLLLQAGVAGTLDDGLKLTQVVAVGSECIGDAGVQQGSEFRSLFDLKLLNAGTPPWMAKKLLNESSWLQYSGLPVVNGVTINEISTGKERILYYRQVLKADVESMEGAALHYVGLMEKIPFLQIRSLSNYIGERDKTRWKMKQAVAALNNELQQFIKKLFSV